MYLCILNVLCGSFMLALLYMLFKIPCTFPPINMKKMYGQYRMTIHVLVKVYTARTQTLIVIKV